MTDRPDAHDGRFVRGMTCTPHTQKEAIPGVADFLGLGLPQPLNKLDGVPLDRRHGNVAERAARVDRSEDSRLARNSQRVLQLLLRGEHKSKSYSAGCSSGTAKGLMRRALARIRFLVA